MMHITVLNSVSLLTNQHCVSTHIGSLQQSTGNNKQQQEAVARSSNKKQWQEAAARSSGKKWQKEAVVEAVPACITMEQAVATTAAMTVMDNVKNNNQLEATAVQSCSSDSGLKQTAGGKEKGEI